MRKVLAATAFALCLASPTLAQVTATLPANPVEQMMTLNGFERFIYSASLGGWVRTG